ncbi:NADPH:quinone reductase [Halobacteriales archaeon QS_1_68_20]|nr:MAG: NADPH:quinone reductase [Halobacteriales archaeon QS_1_68_20]
MRAIEVTEYGDADALSVVDREAPSPGEGAVRITVEAAGINFADVQMRRGHYPGGPEPPFVPGMEAAGTVAETGEGVDLPEGQRVVAMTTGDSYAEEVVAPADSLFPIPEGMSFAEAAGFPVQFLTAHNSLFGWDGLEEGERVLVHAAAGGVGTAAVQLAAHEGTEVFGTASTAEKLDLAERLGVDHPINYTEEDFGERVDEITDGAGVDLVLDGVGGNVFDDSLDALAHFGRLVTIGVASGDPPAAPATKLLMENKRVIGFHLGNAVRHDPGRVLGAVPELTELLTEGDLEVVVGETFDLDGAAEAHAHLEGRGSVGKVVLEP